MTDITADSRDMAAFCARLLDEQKMDDIKVFDVHESVRITDCFVIATGKNPRHLKAAADRLIDALRDAGITRRGREGYQQGRWILIDLLDVVVHLFLADARRFYDLELLWGDSPRIDWEKSSGPAPDERRRAADGS